MLTLTLYLTLTVTVTLTLTIGKVLFIQKNVAVLDLSEAIIISETVQDRR